MEMAGFILFAFAAVAAVILFVLRGQDAAKAKTFGARVEVLEQELAALKAEATTRKETLEARTKELAEVKEKLHGAKKRLHDEKGSKRNHEIEHAKAEVEREAQAQIEAARKAAAEAQLEVKRLQAELETARGKKRPDSKIEARVDLTKPDAAPADAKPEAPRPPRELTQVEQDRIALLEKQAVKQAERVKQLEEDAKRQQRRAENTDKAYKVAKSELELTKSKMTGIEKRLNRSLLELDTLRQKAFKAGLVNEIVTAQAEAEVAEPTSPADTPLPAPEAKA